jgi:hypothetical protein
MPEGEFEEAPLGSKDTVTPPAPTPVSAPNAWNAPSHGSPSADVAAPPPGFSRDSTPEPEASPAPGSDASVAPIAATPAEPPPVAAQPEPASVAVQPEPAPVAKQAAPAPEVTDAPLTPGDAADLDTRIASLEEQVNRDEAAIQSILSQPREADAPRVAERPDFREIAQRLPGLQANLKVLREQRARQSGP